MPSPFDDALLARADGGAALIVDYGRDGPYRDSLAGIRQHALVDVLEQPGTADLSARVDFDAVRLAVRRSGAAAAMHGPITQAQLLEGLGIRTRLESLAQGATAEQQEALMAGYARLVGGSGGGEDAPRGRGTRRQRRAKGGDDGSVDLPVVEGMGHSYKAVCICPEGVEPVVFSSGGGGGGGAE